MGRSVDEETVEQSHFIPHIKMNALTNASTESQHVDVDAIRRDKFRQRNVHGHSSDSAVAKLLHFEAATETEPAAADVLEPGFVVFLFLINSTFADFSKIL